MDEILNFFYGPSIFSKLLKVFLIILIFTIIKQVIQKIFESKIEDKVENAKNRDKKKTVLSIIKSAINVVLYFIAITFILNVFNVNTTSILAVAGVGGMAIAFASQSIIEDVISGAIIITENQFNIH